MTKTTLASALVLSILASACGAAAPMAPPPADMRASEPGGVAGIASPPAPPPMASVAPSEAAMAAKDASGGMAREGAPVMQAPAGVKAGEWDDNANWREFQKYLASESATGFHAADVRDRQFLVVRDSAGKGVPRCEVVVRDGNQHEVKLTTTASGRALLFPHNENLSGKLTATTTCSGSTARASFATDQGEGIVKLDLSSARQIASRDVDLAFILDTTGSMSEEISAVKSTIQKVTTSLASSNVHVRLGLVEYKDRGDEFVTKVYPMSTDAKKFAASVAGIEAGGGGDTPESMNEGLHVGLSKLDWNGSAVAKIAFLIADAPPHLDYANDFDYAKDMREASHRGIQVFTVAASGMDDLGQVVFRQIAEYTAATNLFVLRGGAGPQSTGAGDPKSSCGGTQTNYASGNLDALIVQKVKRELGALDRDPLAIPGIGEDENAKPCGKRLIIAE